MSRTVKTPGPDHPIDIRRAGRAILAVCAGRIVARSDDALIMSEARHPDVIYFPRGDVDMLALDGSATSSWCPYKGEASYFSLRADDTRDGVAIADIAWSYESPLTAMSEIAGHLAFYTNKVTVEDA